MNDFKKENGAEEIITPVVFCKSGKDRTGIQEEYSTAKILANQQDVFSEKELFKHSIESKSVT
jgi:threonyl-tRNA synthetase